MHEESSRRGVESGKALEKTPQKVLRGHGWLCVYLTGEEALPGRLCN